MSSYVCLVHKKVDNGRRWKTSPGAFSDFLLWSSEQLNIDDFKLFLMYYIKTYLSMSVLLKNLIKNYICVRQAILYSHDSSIVEKD